MFVAEVGDLDLILRIHNERREPIPEIVLCPLYTHTDTVKNKMIILYICMCMNVLLKYM